MTQVVIEHDELKNEDGTPLRSTVLESSVRVWETKGWSRVPETTTDAAQIGVLAGAGVVLNTGEQGEQGDDDDENQQPDAPGLHRLP